jgi:hypothetical protein
MIDDLFDSKKVTIEKLRQLNLLHRESFFSRQRFESAFSSLSFETFDMIIKALINALIKKTLSTFDLIPKESITTEDFDITGGSDTIEDPDITDDITGETTKGTDTTSDPDTTDDIIGGTTRETDITGETDIIDPISKRRRSNSHDEESCDCRDSDVA